MIGCKNSGRIPALTARLADPVEILDIGHGILKQWNDTILPSLCFGAPNIYQGTAADTFCLVSPAAPHLVDEK